MTPRRRHTIYLGLGSNMGDRQLNVARAIALLRRVFEIDAVSGVDDTAPVGFTEQPRFINVVVRGRTERPPREVLAEIKRIERELGRRPDDVPRFGPRPIDVDLLLYDDIVRRDPPDDASGEPCLIVPHPRLHERAFVLVPLADIDPGLVHPELGATVADLLARVDAGGVVPLDEVLDRSRIVPYTRTRGR